jgi:hypothetical protein
VLGKTSSHHTSAEFVAFLAGIIAIQPKGKEIHLIVHNLSADKTKAVQAFLAQPPSVHLRSDQCCPAFELLGISFARATDVTADGQLS